MHRLPRLIPLLCLSVVACSHDARPAETADVTNGPNLQPASLEGTPAAPEKAPPARSQATPRNTEVAPDTIPPREPPPAAADTQPDNTKVNERDRNSNTLTPLDQGNGESDLKLTQSIRRAVMADKALSFTAKNVKIITKDGKVTLRGPVKTDEERAAIEADARNAAGTAPIDNQIEVKK